MEYLRDGSIDEAAPQKETSEAIAIIDSGEEKELNPGDAAVELQTPEAWSDLDEIKKGTGGKLLNWLKVIGNNKKISQSEWVVFIQFLSEKKVLPCAVLLLGLIYASVAANFYFE